MGDYGSVARFYDDEYGRTRGDVDFYLERLASQRVRGAVLEPGCGTGRVAVPLALAGYGVTGFDRSEAMLRRARRRRLGLPPDARLRLRLSRQSMASFAFRHRFGAAILAFSTFNLLDDPDDRQECLRRLALHLEPGGLLLMDMVNAEAARRVTAAASPRPAGIFVTAARGHVVEKTVEEREDPARRVTEVRYLYRQRRYDDDRIVGEVEVAFALARIPRAEVEAALYGLGFDVEAVFGDHAGHPVTPRSPRMIVQARRLG